MKHYLYLSLALLCTIALSCETPRSGTRSGRETGGTARADLVTACVPAVLRDLVPMAAQWGCADPAARDAMEKEMTAEQAVALRDALHARVPQIRAWLGTAPRSGPCAGAADAFSGLLEIYEDVSDMNLMRGLR